MYRTILFLGVLVTAAVAPIVLYSVRNGGGTSFVQQFKNMTAASTESEPSPSNSLLPEEPSGRLRDPAIAALLEPPVKPKSMVVAPVVTSLPEINSIRYYTGICYASAGRAFRAIFPTSITTGYAYRS